MKLQSRLYAASLLVLALGMGAALLIYFTAEDDADAALQAIYATKPYVRELQRFGGKAAVLFDEFSRWFGALWIGKKLAFTVAWISLFASLGIFACARRLEGRE
jgi:hypothetical protein